MTPLEIYESCFGDKEYSSYDEVHYPWALSKVGPGRVVDICSGRGHILMDLLRRCRPPATILSVDLKNFHGIPRVPFLPADLETVSGRQALEEVVPSFENLICLNSLEHFTEDSITALLKIFSKIKQRAILTVGMHSDIFHGVELHVTNRPWEWWADKIGKHFEIEECLIQHSGQLACFVCSPHIFERSV